MKKLSQTENQPKCPQYGGTMEIKEIGVFKIHEAVLLYILGILFIAFDLWISVFADSAHGSAGNGKGLIWVPLFIGMLFYKIKQNVLKKVWKCPACQDGHWKVTA